MKPADTYRKQSESFGPWLASRIKQAGLTQAEFAKRVGASKSSVSRWIHGRVPEASFIDAIADVLVVDYDTVATKAGYRPRELGDEAVDPDSPVEMLCAMVRKIQWDQGRYEPVESMLRAYLEQDRRARQQGQDSSPPSRDTQDR